MTDELLKSFILYCQAVEVTFDESVQATKKAYNEWKNYWMNYYMNEGKDLYNAFDYTKLWSKNQKNNFGF